jgi:hypothetical protein
MARPRIERCIGAFWGTTPWNHHRQPGTLPAGRLPVCLAVYGDRDEAHGVRVRPLADPDPVHLQLSRAWNNRMATLPRLGVTASRILALQPYRRSCRCRGRLVVCPDLPPVLGTGPSLATDPPGQFFRTNDRGDALPRPPLLADLRAFEARKYS